MATPNILFKFGAGLKLKQRHGVCMDSHNWERRLRAMSDSEMYLHDEKRGYVVVSGESSMSLSRGVCISGRCCEKPMRQGPHKSAGDSLCSIPAQ